MLLVLSLLLPFGGNGFDGDRKPESAKSGLAGIFFPIFFARFSFRIETGIYNIALKRPI